jgi:cobalt-precorrin 5A hydrolase/precorrin-3B C17-methyltransferase
LCNVADDPHAGDFHLPAVHREPGLLVAVSTAGTNPARAKRLRDQIAAWLAGGPSTDASATSKERS